MNETDREHETAGGILVETRPAPGVAMLRLQRPKVLNALNLALRRELAAAFIRLDADRGTRAIVMTGSERAFCAGADLTEYVDATPGEIGARDMGRLWDAIASCRAPVIAAVRGHALGGGCELAMHADLIVAGRSARFAQPEVLIGLMPGGGATQRLPRALGKFRALRLLLTGEAIDAAQAHAWGLVSDLVDDDQLEAFALALAQRIAALPASAVQATKAAVIAGMDSGLSQGLRLERASFQTLFDSADKYEGIRARLDQRPANFNRVADA